MLTEKPWRRRSIARSRAAAQADAQASGLGGPNGFRIRDLFIDLFFHE
jgi:hypothetical protein